jgi:hypothetical protein
MPNPGRTRRFPKLSDAAFEVGDPSSLADHREALIGKDGDPGGVITPILEMGQTRYENLGRRASTYVTNYAAHAGSTPVA